MPLKGLSGDRESRLKSKSPALSVDLGLLLKLKLRDMQPKWPFDDPELRLKYKLKMFSGDQGLQPKFRPKESHLIMLH
jgi:hypothetical protein